MTHTMSETQRQMRELETRKYVSKILEKVDDVVTREARTLGWSVPDAKMIVERTTASFLTALARGEPTQEALSKAYVDAEHQHVIRYVNLVAQEGKMSARQALMHLLSRRLDRASPAGDAAFHAAIKAFDADIIKSKEIARAVDAARDAALACLGIPARAN